MERMLSLDQALFLAVNHLPHTEAINMFALAVSGVGSAGIIWFLIAILLFFKEEKKDHWFFLPVVLAGSSSWVLVELILKPLIARTRPAELIGAIIIGSTSRDFSMPSGHATIAFAMATILAKKEPTWRWLFRTLAILIAFTRIYLGKHFPADVLIGALIGSMIGLFTNYLTKVHAQT